MESMTAARPKLVTAPELRDLIVGGGELALLDLRGEGIFGDGHLLFAVSATLSWLEMVIDDLVPRQSAPIVLCAGGDGDDDLITRGAQRLAGAGYFDISISCIFNKLTI